MPWDSSSSDENLMLCYRNGDAAAFDELYSRRKGGLHRYLLRQCRNAATAEDLFQDIWMNLIHVRRTYAVTAKFTTYLFQLAHNRLVDHYRKRAPGSTVSLDDEDEPELDEPVEPAPPGTAPAAQAPSAPQAPGAAPPSAGSTEQRAAKPTPVPQRDSGAAPTAAMSSPQAAAPAPATKPAPPPRKSAQVREYENQPPKSGSTKSPNCAVTVELRKRTNCWRNSRSASPITPAGFVRVR